MTRAVLCLALALVVAAPPAAADGIIANPEFDAGGHTYADHWRPLPGVARVLRQSPPGGGHNLYLKLRDDGDGGVLQVVDLPPGRALSLRLLATCWANGHDCVVASYSSVGVRVTLARASTSGVGGSGGSPTDGAVGGE